jgi:hypothetical protein
VGADICDGISCEAACAIFEGACDGVAFDCGVLCGDVPFGPEDAPDCLADAALEGLCEEAEIARCVDHAREPHCEGAGEGGDPGEEVLVVLTPGSFDVATGMLDVLIDSPSDIAGFQFELSTGTIDSTCCGVAQENGFLVQAAQGRPLVLGFNLLGGVIPLPQAGEVVLTQLEVSGWDDGTLCVIRPVVSDPLGDELASEGGCIEHP